ncbi:hypothetical protein B0J18DRAFT_488982 [Chaetomium sp. MPI-SDFR-AT-0129]|nr:hypothetical protein B0J18DRAFT_488982 [Chaetomium sp. MPI-SDFR-AT-0129]
MKHHSPFQQPPSTPTEAFAPEQTPDVVPSHDASSSSSSTASPTVTSYPTTTTTYTPMHTPMHTPTYQPIPTTETIITNNNHNITNNTPPHLNPLFQSKLAQLAFPLAPLVQLTTGLIHPSFPRTMLAFWLLTPSQLDSLAEFYHQRYPSRWTNQYPCPITWPEGMGLLEKRRRMGRFIGLRGCEVPWGGELESQLEGEWGECWGEEWVKVREEVMAMMGRSEEEIAEEARKARGGGGGDEVGEVRAKMGWWF